MGKKIESEGSTLIVSDSEDSDNLDMESMIENTVAPSEPPKEDAMSLLAADARSQAPAPKFTEEQAQIDHVYVEFKEAGTGNLSKGRLQSYYSNDDPHGVRSMHFNLIVGNEELVDWPFKISSSVEEINFLFKDKKNSILSGGIFSMRIASLEAMSTGGFIVFITAH